MVRSRGIATALVVLGCIVIGATGGIVLATRGRGVSAGAVHAPAGFHGTKALSVGTDSACALVQGGRVDCWGVNPDGLLGVGLALSGCDGYCNPQPTALPGISNAVSVGTGDEFACALLRSGTVYCWGANNYGQLGTGSAKGPTYCLVPGGSLSCAQRPVPVSIRDVVSLGVGVASACAVIQGGGVYCWGAATDGVLGNDSAHGSQICDRGAAQEPCSPFPVPVSGLGDARQVSVGSLTACALLLRGRVVCWGDDGYAQLGSGAVNGPQICSGTGEPCSLTPVPVHGVDAAESVSVGSADACAVVAHGRAVCWGDDSEGALGTGSATAPDRCGRYATACAARPQRAAIPGLVTSISAGDEDACATNRSGTAYCWGDAADGALGVGTTGVHTCVGTGDEGDVACAPTPTAVAGIGPVSVISAGYGSSCALVGSTGYCWGENQTGQLGRGGNVGPTHCPSAPGQPACATTPQAMDGWR